MAQKVAEIKVPISLVVEDKDVAEQIQKAYNDATVQANKNKIELQVGVGKDGLVEFTKFIGKIKEEGKNILINIDEDFFYKQIKKLGIKSKKEIEQLKGVLNDALKFNTKDSPIYNISDDLMKQINKFDGVIAKIDEFRSKVIELNSTVKSEIENNLKISADKYLSNRNEKNAINFMAALEHYQQNNKDKNIDYTDPKGIKRDLNGVYNSIVNSSKEKYGIGIDSLLSQVSEVVKELENNKKKYDDEIQRLSSQIKNELDEEYKKLKPDVKTSDNQSEVSVKPINLEEFYKEIENYRKANIQIEISNKEELFKGFENKTVDVKINPLLEGNKPKIDSNAKETVKSIQQELTKIFKSAEKNWFSSDDFLNLNNLFKQYKDVTGKNLNINKLFSAFNIDKNKYINDFNEAKKNFTAKSSGLDLDLSVELKVNDGEISNLKTKIEQGINPIDVDINLPKITEENNYNSVIKDLKEIIALQEQMKIGNKDIASVKSKSGKLLASPLINTKNGVRSNSTTKTSVERALKEFNSADSESKNAAKEKLAAHVGAYKDVVSAYDLFGAKNKELWTEVITLIENATKAQQAYNALQEKSQSILEKTALLGNADKKDLTDKDRENFINSLNGGANSAADFLNKRFGTQISGIAEKAKSELSSLDTYIEQAFASVKEISLNGIEPVDVKFVPKTEDLDNELKRIKDLSPIQLEVNLKDITEGTDKIDVSGVDSSINNLKQNVIGIGSAFNNIDHVVLESSIKQMSSIDSVTSSVKELKAQMESVGINTLTKIQKVSQEANNQSQEVNRSNKKLTGSEMLDVKRSILSASDLTSDISIDPNTVKVSESGIVSLDAVIEDLGDTYTVAKIKIEDFKKSLNEDGSFNADYINKSIIELKQNVKKINSKELKDKFSEALNLSDIKIDENSLKVNAQGVASFSKTIRDANGELVKTKYIIDDIDKVLNSDGSINAKMLDSFKLKSNNPIEQVKEALSKTKGVGEIDEKSFKLDKSGVVTFNDKLNETRFLVNDISKLLADNGGFNVNLLKNSSIQLKELSEIEKNKTDLIKIINEINGLKVNSDSTDEGTAVHERINELIQKRDKLQEQIDIKLDKEKLTLLEINTINKEIEDVKNKEVKAYDIAESKLYRMESSLEKAKELDVENLKDINVKDSDGNLVNLRTQYETLRNEAILTYDKISSGNYSGRIEAQNLSNELTAQISKMKELAKANNLMKNSKGNVVGDIELSGKTVSRTNKRETEKKILEQLKKAYGESSVFENTDFNRDTGKLFTDVINDGQIKRVTASLREFTSANGEARVEVRALASEEEKYLSAGQRWYNGFKTKIHSLTQYMTGLELVMRGWQELKQGFTFVKDLNSLMTTIYQTSDITKDGLEQLSQGAINQAKAMGVATEQVSGAIEVYAAYGETVDSLLNKAAPTTMLAKAANTDVGEASNWIMGVTQQYEELEGMESKVVNAFEKISANLKIDFTDSIRSIAEGTQVAGSVAKSAGMEFNDFAASIGTVSEKTRSDGKQIANAYKTIMARASRSKVPGEDVSAEERGEAAKALSGIGIELYNDKGEYQDFSKTLDELSAKWDNLTDSQRANVSEGLAGVRNLNTMTAIVETWQDAKNISAQVEEDPDFYLEVQEKGMDSVKSQVDTLKATMQDMWYNLLDTDILNTGISALSGVVEVGKSIIDVFKSVGSVFGDAGESLGGMAGAATVLYTAFKGYESFQKGEGFFGGIKSVAKDGSTLLNPKTYKNLFDAFKEGAVKGRELVTTGSTIGDAFDSVTNSATSTDGVISKLGGKFGELAGKLGISNAALGGWTVGILAVGTAAIAAWNNIETSAEMSENATKKFEEYKNSIESINDKNKTVKDIAPRYIELSSKINVEDGEMSLINDELTEYQSISKQIADAFPTLISGYDAQGNAIVKLKDGVKSLNEEYERQLKIEEQRNIDDNAEDYIDDYRNKTGNRGFWTGLKDSLGDFVNNAFTGDEFEIGKAVDTGRALDILKEFQGKSVNQLNEVYKNLDLSPVEQSMLSGLGLENISEITAEQWDKVHNTINTKIIELESDVTIAETRMKSLMTSYLNTLTLSGGKFDDIDDELSNNISKLISGLDDNALEDIIGDASGDEAISKLNDYVIGIVSKLEDNPEAQISLNNLLKINDNSSLEELEKAITDDLDILSKGLDKDKTEVSIQLGLEGKEEVIKGYKEVKKIISDDLDKQAANTINKLELQAKEIGGNANINRKAASSDDLKKAGWNSDGKDSSFVTQTIDTKKASIVVSPVLPSGEVMTPDEFSAYINDVIKKGNKDTKGVTLATFNKKDVKNSKDVRKEADKFAKLLKESEKYSGYLGDNQSLVNDFMRDNNIVTQEQYELLQKCYEETGNWTEAMSKFSSENIDLALNEEILQSLEDNLKIVESHIEAVDQAIEGTNSTVGMSREEIDSLVKTFSGLDGYNYDKLFESTAEGVKVNAQELERLNDLYEEQESSKYSKTIENLKDQYTATSIKIAEATQGTEEYNKALSDRDAIVQQIKDAQELQSMYEGMTNAVTKYFRAKESTDPDKDYLAITNDIETIEEMWDSGEVGRDEFQAFVQMFTNANLESIEDFKNAYDGSMRKAKRYFTENGVGAENFLKDMNKKMPDLVKLGKDKTWSIDASIEKISNEMGITQATIQEMFNRLKIFGFDIDFKESEDYLRKLRDEALEANKVFKGMGDIKFDLDVEGSKDIRESIDKMEYLKESIKDAYGGNSNEYSAFIKQLNYLKAKLGDISKEEYVVDIHSSDGIKNLEKDLEKLNKLNNTKIAIDFDNQDASVIQKSIDDITEATRRLKRDDDNTIIVEQEGAEETIRILSALVNQKNEIENDSRVILTMDSSQLSGSAKQAIDSLKEVEKAYQDYKLLTDLKDNGIKINIKDLKAAEETLISTAKTFADNNIEASAAIKFNDIKYDAASISEKMKSIDASTILKIDGVDDTAFKNYNPNSKTVVFDVNDEKVKGQMNKIDSWVATKKTLTFDENGTLSSIYHNYNSIKNKTIEIKTKYISEGIKTSGVGEVNGNVNFGGSSFANGTVGAPNDEVALVGEEDPELLVDRSTGRWKLLGKHGAEFTKIKRGDLIFNAQQTKELFKNGHVKSKGGRGKAFVDGNVGKFKSLFRIGSGNAYVDGGGKYSSSGSLPGSNKFYNNYNKDKDKKKKDGKEDTYKESFDWIEVAIQRIEEAISRLDIVVQSTYKSFTKRNSTLSQEFNKVTEQIDIQRKAYNTYMTEANKINLSSTYKKKVQNGTMNIETLKGEGNKDLVERIKEYENLYNKAIESKDAILELQENLADLASQRFDNVVSEYDAKLGEIETKINKIETGLGIVEASGQFASRNYYDTLMSIEQENINMLTSEYNSLNKAFNEAMSTGTIEAYSEQWYSMRQEINEVSESLLEAQQSLIEYKNEMREMDWSIFEKTHEYISELSKESDFLIELLSFNESELFNKDTGKFTDKADSIAGLRAVNYNQYMAQADMYRKKVEEINKELANDPTNTILIDKKNEYIEAQRESILAANDERQAIIDLIENSYEKQLEILQEIIEKRKEELNAEKDLFDYQKNIAEQTKNLTDLQKQYLSLQNDDSESAISKKQQLKDQIEQSKSDLEDSEYERWISDQQILLDQLYDEYETVLMSRLDNIDGLINEVIDSTNANSSTIDQTIKDTTANVGYQVTDGMKNIWSDTGSGIGKIVTDYSNNFSSTMTATNSYIQQCVNLLNQIVAKANSNSSANTGGVVKPTTPPASSGGSSSSSTSKPTTTPPASKPSSSSSSTKSKLQSLLVYKKDSYPKNKLQINTSINL